MAVDKILWWRQRQPVHWKTSLWLPQLHLRENNVERLVGCRIDIMFTINYVGVRQLMYVMKFISVAINPQYLSIPLGSFLFQLFCMVFSVKHAGSLSSLILFGSFKAFFFSITRALKYTNFIIGSLYHKPKSIYIEVFNTVLFNTTRALTICSFY